mmetsp:Transcript_36727/g.84519  ORF Transcript_36727/g.84519 Transcript_36727/m.84519 type:complete len:119 (-) Transcript_36727:137-493(-)
MVRAVSVLKSFKTPMQSCFNYYIKGQWETPVEAFEVDVDAAISEFSKKCKDNYVMAASPSSSCQSTVAPSEPPLSSCTSSSSLTTPCFADASARRGYNRPRPSPLNIGEKAEGNKVQL